MELNTNPVEGVKVLHKAPELLEGKIKRDTKIIDFGNLSNYRKFMIDNKGKNFSGSDYSEKEGKWYGSETYEEFLKILDEGDLKVMEQIKFETKKNVKELTKKYEEKLINYKFDVTGEFFDIGLVVTGVPESWGTPEFQPEEKIQTELFINGAFHGGFDKNKIVGACSKILGMVKVLEDHGVEVKIRLMSNNVKYTSSKSENGSNLIGLVTVKDYDEPLNFMKCSALFSPTFHRRGMFKAMEKVADKALNHHTYGKPEEIEGIIDLRNGIDGLERRLFK